MESSAEQFENLIASRLLISVEAGVKRSDKKTAHKQPLPDPTDAPGEGNQTSVAAIDDFIKVEKNLASMGFFTPSSKRVRSAKSKIISFTRWIDGKRIEARATIAPSALYGLPITADQDKWFALQTIISELRHGNSQVTNPVSFTSAEMLRLLGKNKDSGKNYQEISEWLDVMTGTLIISEGVVYFAGKRTFAKDRFHVFERAVSVGKELEPGVIADRNYVWLSAWQLENINNHYLLPIDFETYKQLKNHIAKALVPLLQIWLYATKDEGLFEKRYDELCQILNIREYKHLSEIIRNFSPSLDELKTRGYLSAWEIEKTNDGKAYKIVFYHGEKFRRDQLKRLEQREQRERRKLKLAVPEEQGREVTVPVETLSKQERALFKQLNLDFGVQALKAFELVKTKPEQTKVQVEAYPYRTGKTKNPAGFIIEAIEQEYNLPENLLEAQKQAAAQAKAAKEEARLKAERDADALREIEQMQREEEAKARAKAYLEKMPEGERQLLREQCVAEVKNLDFWKSHKDSALFENMVLSKMTARVLKQHPEIGE